MLTRFVQSKLDQSLNLNCKSTDYKGFWTFIWSPVIGGCRLDRRVEEAFAAAGDWEIAELGHDDDQPWKLMPRVWGRFIKL